MPTFPVIAAIPNYNMAKGLQRLLPQLLKQDYAHIYVLDDASTDNSEEVAKSFGSKVTFVKSKVNGGAGAARNQLMPFLKDKSLIHFLDADVSILTSNAPSVIQNLSIDDSTGFIIGLVCNTHKKQSVWNYGAKMSLASMVSSWFAYGYSYIENKYPKVNLKALYAMFWQRPNPHRAPKARPIFWGSEANIIIRSDTFKELGGFDPKIREHDIQPLAYKAAKEGLVSRFEPQITVQTHDDLNVRRYNRNLAMLKAEWYILRTYSSPLRWLFGK